eukprot:SAG31_NODE_3391_length_4326_cov_6.489236_4_plen_97_part_01
MVRRGAHPAAASPPRRMMDWALRVAVLCVLERAAVAQDEDLGDDWSFVNSDGEPISRGDPFFTGNPNSSQFIPIHPNSSQFIPIHPNSSQFIPIHPN